MRSLWPSIVSILLGFSGPLMGFSVIKESQLEIRLSKKLEQKLEGKRKEAFIERLKEISELIHTIKVKNLPAPILKKIKTYKVQIEIKENIRPIAYFVYPEKQSIKEKLKIYINPFLIDSPDLKRLVTHEFFHSIHFILNKKEDEWVREGLAQMFEYYILRRPNGKHLNAGLKSPSISLFSNYDHSKGISEVYGHSLLYFHYLLRECGGKNLFWTIATSNTQDGLHSVNQSLKSAKIKKPQCKNVTQSILYFEMAKIHNQSDFMDFDNSNKFFVGSAQFSGFKELPFHEEEIKLASPYKISKTQGKSLFQNCFNCRIVHSNKEFMGEIKLITLFNDFEKYSSEGYYLIKLPNIE